MRVWHIAIAGLIALMFLFVYLDSVQKANPTTTISSTTTTSQLTEETTTEYQETTTTTIYAIVRTTATTQASGIAISTTTTTPAVAGLGGTASTSTTNPTTSCSSNEDCGGTFQVKRCDKSPGTQEYIAVEQVSFVCRKASCVQLQPVLMSKEYCDDDEVCLNVSCYPDHCANIYRDLDLDEEGVDCGGPCPECREDSIMCKSDYDCQRPFLYKECSSGDGKQWVLYNYQKYACIDGNMPQSKCIATNMTYSLKSEMCGYACTLVNGNPVCMNPPSSNYTKNEKYLIEFEKCGGRIKYECAKGLVCCEERGSKCVYNCQDSSGDISLCERISVSPQIKCNCYVDIGVKLKSLEVCEEVQDQGCRDVCHINIMLNLKDPALCEGLREQSKKDDCYRVVAISLKDDTFCSRIHDNSWRDVCYIAVSQEINKTQN